MVDHCRLCENTLNRAIRRTIALPAWDNNISTYADSHKILSSPRWACGIKAITLPLQGRYHSSILCRSTIADLAHSAEQLSCKQHVRGAKPRIGTSCGSSLIIEQQSFRLWVLVQIQPPCSNYRKESAYDK